VVESLASLRHAALVATSRHDPVLRRATPEEIALAESQRKPNHCIAYSSRTGLPCTCARLLGSTTCYRHGASTKAARAAARARIDRAVMPAIGRMIALSKQNLHLPTAQKAAADLLDRAGMGDLVQAKVHHATKGGSGNVTVNIGFLSVSQTAQDALPTDLPTTDMVVDAERLLPEPDAE
jgi:hypothetical protein